MTLRPARQASSRSANAFSPHCLFSTLLLSFFSALAVCLYFLFFFFFSHFFILHSLLSLRFLFSSVRETDRPAAAAAATAAAEADIRVRSICVLCLSQTQCEQTEMKERRRKSEDEPERIETIHGEEEASQITREALLLFLNLCYHGVYPTEAHCNAFYMKYADGKRY